MPDFTPGAEFAGYRIEGPAGSGGMGVVWRATQIALDRPVALKLIAEDLTDDPLFRERFKRESQLAAAIDHPNVIPVYEAGEAEGRLFIAMRYVPGVDMATLLRTEQPDPVRVIGLVSQVAAALDAAHRGGLVHRDVKPANVLIADSGESEHAYLTDFGLTKRTTAASGLTRTGEFVGTLDYVAPEQIEGKAADARADIYALGCVLFHGVTGRRVFERDSDVAKLYAHLQDSPPRVSETAPQAPAGLDAVVTRALAKDPAERYPSAGDLARAARAALEGHTIEAPEQSVATGAAAPTSAAATVPAPAPPPVPPTVPAATEALPPAGRPPRRGLLFGGAVALVLAAVAAAVVLAGGGDDRDSGGGGGEPAVDVNSVPKIAATIRVGDGPDGVAADGDFVLVANAKDGTATLVEAKTGEVAGRPVEAGENPDSVAGAKGVFWVTATDEGEVHRIETESGAAVGAGTAPVGGAPEGVALSDQMVWVANADDGTVSRVDRASATPVGDPVEVGREPAGVTVGVNTVWVADSGDDKVTRIDPATARTIGSQIPVGDYPRAIVEAGGFAWVTNARDDTVTRINASTGQVTGDPIRVGKTPRDITAGAGRIWVGNAGDGTVTAIDAKTGRVAGSPTRVGKNPIGLAFGAGSLWVANMDDDTLMRITP